MALERTGSFFLMPQISFASGPGRGEDLFLMERDGHLRRIGEGYVAVAW